MARANTIGAATSDLAGRRLEDELKARLVGDPQVFDFLQGSVLDGVWFWDLERPDEEWMSAAFWETLGYDPAEQSSSPSAWQDIIDPDDLAVATANFERHALNPRHPYDQIVRYRRPDGTIAWMRCRGIALRDANGRPIRMLGAHQDVTELKRREIALARIASQLEAAQAHAARQALIDPLTGLANRRGLEHWIAETNGRPRAILQIDLDNFKTINDLYGHAAGDAALRHAARAIRASVGDADFVARIGGDEFVVATACAAEACSGCALARGIIARVTVPLDHDGRMLAIGASIGVACDDDGRLSSTELLKNADAALYAAKATERGSCARFTKAMEDERRRRRDIAEALLLDIEADAIEPFYQTQVDAETGAIIGVEALARWRRQGPDGETILPPAAFLDVAEALGLLARIDAAILRRALFDMARIEAAGGVAPRVAVNVSARRLMQPTFLDEVARLAPPKARLSMELVESIFLDEASTGIGRDVGETVDRLRGLGVEIELDDFGSGHASLIALTTLRPNRLKIDRRLVMPIVESVESRALVRSILDIARTLGVECVAEGVETADHAAMLRDMGCQILQGYHFSRPMPFDALAATLDAADAARAA